MKAILAVSFMLLLSGFVVAQEKKTFEQDLLDAIDKIAVQHGISKDQAMQKAHALCNDDECWGVKGDIAIIRDSMYVFARARNGVIIGDERIYGAESTVPELYVLAGKKLVGTVPIPKGDENDVLVVLFTPEKVRFFDWKELSGGFYPRNPK